MFDQIPAAAFVASLIPFGWTLAIMAIAAFVIYICSKRSQAAFEERFPPITDDEFMALCRPGTSRAVALKVRRIVADQLGVDYDRVYPSSRFVEDLGV